MEWEWGKWPRPRPNCAGLICRFRPLCRVFAYYTAQTYGPNLGSLSGDVWPKIGPFIYYPTFGALPPWLVACLRFLRRGRYASGPGSGSRPPGSVPGSGFVSKKDPFLIAYTLGAVWPESVFLGGLGVVGPFPVHGPFVLPPSPVKSLANKKRARLGPFLSRC